MKELLSSFKVLLFLPLLLLYAYSGISQTKSFEFKIQILEKDSINAVNQWGVYVRPTSGFAEGANGTVTASGQLTIMMNHTTTDSILNIESVNGVWKPDYDLVRAPLVGGTWSGGIYTGGTPATKDYFFIGFDYEGDGIPLVDGEETLLLTFTTNNGCPTELELINNDTDPFNILPNSEGNNPGMDLAVFNTNTGEIHNWLANYAPGASSCQDCDNDGIPDGLEDTNGNGQYDDGTQLDGFGNLIPRDSSDLCDACDPLGIKNFSGTLAGDDILNMCSAQDSAGLTVTMTGGGAPYTVYLGVDDGIGSPTTQSIPNVNSGDTFFVKPIVTTDYKLDSIVDALGCALTNPDSLLGLVTVTVEGPLTWDAGGNMPDNVTSCTLDTIYFDVDASNGGDGEILYQWQVGVSSTGPWTDIVNGTPYSFADTDSLIISNPAGLDGNWYRALVFTETCDTLPSLAASLTVEGPFEISANPTDATVCGLDMLEMTAETANLGSGTIVRQWQVTDGTSWTNISNGGNYGGATTDTLDIFPDGAGDISALNDHWYRLKISAGAAGACDDIFTDSAKLVVEGPLTIDPVNLPVSTSSCEGEAACFGVQIDAVVGVVEYQWYLRPTSADPWEAMVNNNQYSGVRSDSMCVLDAVGLDGFEFKVDINTGACTTVSSTDFGTVATLTVTESISFDVDPQSETICGGDSTLFIVDVDSGDGTLVKQWQMSQDGGSTWTDVNASTIFTGITSDTLIVDTRSIITTQPDTLNGRLFRMAVDGDLCDEVLSREAELTVHHFVDTMIVMGPLDTTICSGNPAYFEVHPHASYTGDSDVLKYRWQIFNPNPSVNDFVNLSSNSIYNGVTSNRLSISDVNGFNGMKFRAVVFTNKCDSLVHPSDTIKLTVDGPYAFGEDNDAHPQDTMICAGESAIFSANPVLDLNTPDIFNDGIQYTGDSSTLVYEWVYNAFGEYENPTMVNTESWYTNAGGTAGTGADGTTLTIHDVDNVLDGYVFWLRVRSTECEPSLTIESLPATLNVAGPLTIGGPLMDADNCSDKGAVFGAVVTNGGFGGQQLIEYSWQEIDPSDNWTPIVNDGNYNGASSDTLSIDVLDGLDGNRYALIASINGCGIDTTTLATLTERFPVTVTDNPKDIVTCAGADGFFAVTVDSTGNSNVDLVWQVSTNLGRNWSIVPSATPYTTPRADTLNISDVTGLNGYRYRAAIATSSCDTVFSLPARVTAEGPVVFDAMAPTVEACQNADAEIEATINFSSIGPGVPKLLWEISTDGGTTWDSLKNEGIYDATTTNQLFISQVFEDSLRADNSRRDTLINLNGNQYRIAATTEQCELVGEYFFSDTVTIQTVNDTIGTCDFDLDGEINDVDFDDDNDGLADTIEIYISTFGDPLDSVSQFSTDTNGDGISDSEEDADGDTINNGEETDDDDADGDSDDLDVFTGDPLDPCDPILSPACIGVVLDIRVKLQGAMQGQDNLDLMRDDLRKLSDFPSQEPYSDLKVKRNGSTLNQPFAFIHVDDHQIDPNKGGGEIAPTSLLNDQADPANDIVDWVFVELRSGLQLDSVIATRAALLQRDGEIRDTEPRAVGAPYTDPDGYQYLRFDSTLAGEYYVSVRHRNHLGVMTNEAGLLSPKLRVVDFIDPNMNALGVHPQKMIATTSSRDSEGALIQADSLEQYMWAGDLNSDGKVIYQGGQNDVYEMFNNVIIAPDNNKLDAQGNLTDPLDNFILTGYKRSDYNLDGNTIYQGPLNDKQMLIFNSILSFPDNQKLLANYVILEQLP